MARLLARTVVSLSWQRRGCAVVLDGRDVSETIREPSVSARVSEVSALPAVRRALVPVQRRVARGSNVVCEGRDIGSVVFPDAGLKVYLDCDVRERAARRQRELQERRLAASSRAVVGNLRKRDRIDSTRNMSPLRRVDDAVLIDTTHLSIGDQVAVVCELARERLRPLR
jgi:cytidylate kinase